MISNCTDPRSISELLNDPEVKEILSKLEQHGGILPPMRVSKLLNAVMGRELIKTMAAVPEGQCSNGGLWLVGSLSWSVLKAAWEEDNSLFELETSDKVTHYTGVLGYYRGMYIIIAPTGRRYGVNYVTTS